MGRRAVGQQDELVPPLGQRDEQRQQDRADEQPVADRDVDRHRAGDRAQHEADAIVSTSMMTMCLSGTE